MSFGFPLESKVCFRILGCTSVPLSTLKVFFHCLLKSLIATEKCFIISWCFKTTLKRSDLKQKPFYSLSGFCRSPGISWAVSSLDVGWGCSHLGTEFSLHIKAGRACGWPLILAVLGISPGAVNCCPQFSFRWLLCVAWAPLLAWWLSFEGWCPRAKVARRKSVICPCLEGLSSESHVRFLCILLVRALRGSAPGKLQLSVGEAACAYREGENLGCICGD